MVQKDFLLDLDLYICERFGYRNSLHVTQTMNGFCVSVRIKPVKFYIRFGSTAMAWIVFPTGASSLCTATLPRSRSRNCRNLCGSSRSMCHDMGTST